MSPSADMREAFLFICAPKEGAVRDCMLYNTTNITRIGLAASKTKPADDRGRNSRFEDHTAKSGGRT